MLSLATKSICWSVTNNQMHVAELGVCKNDKKRKRKLRKESYKPWKPKRKFLKQISKPWKRTSKLHNPIFFG